MPAPSDEVFRENDAAFLEHTADRLAALPTVRAVTLGGSRAQGTHRPDSDWDMAVYYRGPFAPSDLRAIGWPGEVSEIGDWGGGVFNGGAWLTIDGRRVDVHYRDLDTVDRVTAEAENGDFQIEPLLFHLAGIPTYLLLAELAINRVLRGSLPRPAAYPQRLRVTAPTRWLGTARATLAYAQANHAPASRRTETAGFIAVAAAHAAHGVLAARGEWVTNEKRLLERADLRTVDDIITSLTTGPDEAEHEHKDEHAGAGAGDVLTAAITRTQQLIGIMSPAGTTDL
ncbi:nucleotidyltransferase domain-containing protein [Streptomyces sp. NPDC059477]|uniref:nucleotidyltransferase domain-containing protein n=1 Tax=Streptomyces sp. NPDC059477 TaxID=3346847 RepID=UPI0036A427D4